MWEYLVKRIRPPRPQVESTEVHRPHAVDAGIAGDGVSAHGESTASETYAQPGSDAHAGSAKSSAEHSPRRSRRAPLRCPVCDLPMQLERIARVEIDRCGKCGGIFLDRGELAELSGRDPSSYVPAKPRADDKGFLIYTPHGLTDHVRDS